MATREIIDFIINMGGNVAQGANAAANAIDRLGASAKKTAAALANDLGKSAKALSQNQLISEFETLSSLLIQVGGSTSQLGVLMSSAARPVALLTQVVGGAGVALLAIPAAAAGAVVGINAVAAAGEEAIKTLQEMGRVDLISRDQLVALSSYRAAVDDLSANLAGLKAQAGAAAAPGAARTASAGSLLMSGDRQAWGAVGQMIKGPFGVIEGMENLKKIADSRTAEALAEKRALDDFRNNTLISMRQMEDEEKRRKDAAKASGAAITAADAERAKIARENEAAAKKEQAAMEQAWNLYDGMLDDIRRITAEFDKVAKDNPAAVFQSEAIAKAAKENEYKRTLEAMGQFKDLEKANKEAAEDALGKIDDADFIMNRVRYDKHGRIIAERALRDPAYDARMLGTAAAVAGGTDVGSIVASAGGGPVGMILGQLANGGAYDAIQGLFDQVMEIYTDLPKEIGRIVGDLVPEMVRQAPEMAAAFLVLAPAVALELVKAAPELLFAVVDAVLSLPEAFARAVVEAFSFQIGGREVGLGKVDPESRGAQIAGGAIAGAFLGGPVGAVAGAALGAYTGRKGGGSSKASRSRQSGGGVVIGQVVSPNPREFARQLRQLQGSYGYGYDLDPAAV